QHARKHQACEIDLPMGPSLRKYLLEIGTCRIGSYLHSLGGLADAPAAHEVMHQPCLGARKFVDPAYRLQDSLQILLRIENIEDRRGIAKIDRRMSNAHHGGEQSSPMIGPQKSKNGGSYGKPVCLHRAQVPLQRLLYG